MGHGLAVHPGSAVDQCGTAGAYFLDYICSTYYEAEFFGLDTSTQPPPTSPSSTAPTTPTTSTPSSTPTSTPSPTPTPTPTSSPTPTPSGTPLPNCYTTDNVSQNLAGRSYFIWGGDSYAVGSNQDMGKYSSTVVSSLQQTSPGYWVVVAHC
jgi:hypothetical protein